MSKEFKKPQESDLVAFEPEVLSSREKIRTTVALIWQEMYPQGLDLFDQPDLKAMGSRIRELISDPSERNYVLMDLIKLSRKHRDEFLRATEFDPVKVLRSLNKELDDKEDS